MTKTEFDRLETAYENIADAVPSSRKMIRRDGLDAPLRALALFVDGMERKYAKPRRLSTRERRAMGVGC